MKDYSLLWGVIKSRDITLKSLAKSLGITPQTLSVKINGHRPFTQDEILMIVKELKIPKSRISDYFFSQKVNE